MPDKLQTWIMQWLKETFHLQIQLILSYKRRLL